ncbi:MAG: 30S ribosomal protein S6 [Candidatus Marinimicrobia bacterium]|jgi:small subunit ribosomal protein S6|nr:30S ribosomal protein S6 [Candidatus Neomarinimicrobiota bacterium]MBT3617383.1 30S ribosomal protein S6 [Candidatus Neomarinimicrobiota bacterium]MBT3829323.1 30S ribosomal protein S6 [Candidatus Neomarinimicrobiota bacterium]MBT3998281.1 30S ribosomal protein S6 [Candidatus Neomarinimicrobiota bacterium]MBT4281582.1 30S ribosomal protein S6 [Candidatus Neomarinimicrobiota bacterium]
MKYYETLYILNPNYEEQRIQDIIGDVNKEAEKIKYSVINHRVWGKKKLSFSISKQKYGTFILLQFETTDSSTLIELETYIKLNKNIMRSQTVKLDERPEVYLEETRKDDVGQSIDEDSKSDVESQEKSESDEVADPEPEKETEYSDSEEDSIKISKPELESKETQEDSPEDEEKEEE